MTFTESGLVLLDGNLNLALFYKIILFFSPLGFVLRNSR